MWKIQEWLSKLDKNLNAVLLAARGVTSPP
jgi:hypothetical protein